jgi:hypothetical protein
MAALAALLLTLAARGLDRIPAPYLAGQRPLTGLLIGPNLGAFVVAFVAGAAGIIALGRAGPECSSLVSARSWNHPMWVMPLHPWLGDADPMNQQSGLTGEGSIPAASRSVALTLIGTRERRHILGRRTTRRAHRLGDPFRIFSWSTT